MVVVGGVEGEVVVFGVGGRWRVGGCWRGG